MSAEKKNVKRNLTTDRQRRARESLLQTNNKKEREKEGFLTIGLQSFLVYKKTNGEHVMCCDVLCGLFLLNKNQSLIN